MNVAMRSVALTVCILSFGTGAARAEEPAAMPADKDAAMKMMMERGSPNENHKVFEPLAGNWTYTGQFWMMPDSAPETMTGTSTNALIYGGRFLKEDVTGASANMPAFEGTGYLGYDNIRNEYQSTWMDNMMTGIMITSGHYDAAAKSITQEGTFSCPMTGETNRWVRSIWTVADNDHNVYESYSRTPDGKEFKSMELRYTRAP